jgi:CO dehydrogenase maturation factor
MNIAITGKGGVGKTTFSSLLARLYAEEHKKVIAVDADPDANLGLALGFSKEELLSVMPISKLDELINERTGYDASTKFFKINPKVDDIPDRFSIEKNGVKLLVMGTVETGGGGCVCPAHVLLKRLLTHLIMGGREETIIMDMEAGLEHLGRGTAGMMDAFFVVIEPGERSVQTYHNIKTLAADLGVKKLGVLANKIRGKEDEDFIKSRIPPEELLGFLTYNNEVINADRMGISPFEAGSVREEISKVKARVDAFAL